jgi:integrase
VGDPPLHKIGIREIEHFLAVKKVEASEWTAKKYHATIASAFETARHWGMLIVNPFRSVTKPKVRDAQPAHFTKRDFQSLLAVVPDRDFRELCICAVSSGLRLGELHSLRWIDVDFVRKVIMVQNSDTFTTKSKRNRVVPMGEQLWHLLAVRREAASDARVFPMKSADHTSKVFKRYIRLAGLSEKLHFHSLRHTFATWLVQDGVPIYGVQKLLGHSSVKMTEVYSHLAASELHSAVNKINLALN